jgi:multidrug transporter EmrE-like cation transporter
MRWLKRLLTVLLIYIGIYLPFVVIMQSVTGYDFTGAYAAVAGVGAVELIVSSLIKREETKLEMKERKNEYGKESF